ncbi:MULTISPECIES: DUF732 domain-containing protein [Mycolicibacterium]|jgi:hypothetical protein|uniref:DUF732 domain-containing protein n=1 Tax=Mycolicibacterium canariasense TaxID=228230 RepID=A0A100WD00_MYCCR|nr:MULTISPECIES: DUF732 domain-containing protein [Mycolicibacterium]MCC9184556.1 DUF732 domain-containing protein [Mycolicibacterium mageritense]ORV09756.1 hypothetical protein AWB94_08605 [Mycolicibacterium canariasense]GAS95694.1 putative uncharacterized protein [Mycolicibacterium canariasense]
MSRTRSQMLVRATAAALAGAAALTVTAAPASAWPIPITGEQQNFINQARNAGFPGGDDNILMAGMQACRVLYMRQGHDAAVASVIAPYGASPQQAAALVGAARGILCTQAPG